MARKHILVPLHIWHLEDLSVTERLVGSVVYGYSEHGRPCFMTNAGFAELLRISKRTASRVICDLIDKGFLDVEEGGHRRHLRWTPVSRGVDIDDRGGSHQCLPVIHKNTELNTKSMDGQIREGEKTPLHWQQVRDYFRHLNDQERTRYGSHLESWAKDFYTYYEARGWSNKHGNITKWRPVALAWYRRSAQNVPQRAVKRFDEQKLRDDIRWHRRRYENYERNDKPMQAHAELVAIGRLEAQLKKHGYAIDA